MAFNASLVTVDAFDVTKSDTAIISAFGIYVGVTGDVSVMPSKQESAPTPTPVLFKAGPAGTTIHLSISRVMSTGTTATNIVAFGPT